MRKPYPSDVSDEEWAFAARYLTLMREDAPQRVYPLREVYNGLRYMVRTGIPWRLMPHDLPPWEMVYQQTQRWLKAGVFQAMAHDLREILRVAKDRNPDFGLFARRLTVKVPFKRVKKGRGFIDPFFPDLNVEYRVFCHNHVDVRRVLVLCLQLVV